MAGKTAAAGNASRAREGDFRGKRVRESFGDWVLGRTILSVPLKVEPPMKRLILLIALAFLVLTVGVSAFAQVTKVIADCEGIT